nr:conserved hypothetical protein [Ipomoea batatas]
MEEGSCYDCPSMVEDREHIFQASPSATNIWTTLIPADEVATLGGLLLVGYYFTDSLNISVFDRNGGILVDDITWTGRFISPVPRTTQELLDSSTQSPSVLCPEPLESLQYSPIQNLIPVNDSSLTVDEITPQDEDEEDRQNETLKKERPTRLDLAACKSRSHSSSPFLDRSCKSLGELELEEIDRDSVYKHEDEDDMERGRVRPYLSDAWLIKSPNSPLLNLRMPRASASGDIKRHLRHWAKTVATVVRQES